MQIDRQAERVSVCLTSDERRDECSDWQSQVVSPEHDEGHVDTG